MRNRGQGMSVSGDCGSVGAVDLILPGLCVSAAALSSVCARRCVSVAGLCLGSRLLFAAWRQTGRLAICFVPVPPGRDRHSCVLAVSVRLSAFAGSLRVELFISGDLDGVPGTRGRG